MTSTTDTPTVTLDQSRTDHASLRVRLGFLREVRDVLTEAERTMDEHGRRRDGAGWFPDDAKRPAEDDILLGAQLYGGLG